MKKKIIFITEALYGGGVQRILQIILSHFDYDRYDVTLYTIRKDIVQDEYFPKDIHYKYIFDVPQKEDLKYHKIWYKLKNKIKLTVYYHCKPKLFYQLFIREKSDISIAFIEGYATRLVAGFPDNIKKIAWLHTDIENNHWSRVAFRNQKEEKAIYNSYIDKIVCVSKIVQEKIIAFSKNATNSVILHNPIDRQYILKSAEKIKILSSPQESLPVIISLGALIDVKGYDRLLKVVSKLKDEGIPFKLQILGKGPKEKDLNDFILLNKISSFVTLLGYHENPYPYLKQSDIYVCSSYAEGYNTAITEALILGKPVVSTECSGVKEQLGDNNEWGICVPNSEEGLYNGLKQMLNPEVMEHYKKQAAIRGKDFTLEKSMDKIYRLIES